MIEQQTREIELREEVPLEHQFEFVLGEVQKPIHHSGALVDAVVVKDIDLSPASQGLFDRCINAPAVHQVEANGQGLAPSLADQCGGLCEAAGHGSGGARIDDCRAVFVFLTGRDRASRNHDVIASLGERQGAGLPDPTASAGHEGNWFLSGHGLASTTS